MKKRLLSMALAAVFCVGTYAYEVGDYMFTKDARLKVAGANIASNEYNATDYWSNENGGPLAANWKVVAIAGPDGSNVTALQSQGASAEEGTALTSAWQLQNGIYAISFYVYSPVAASISITAGGNNFMSLTSGEAARQINAVATLDEAAWTLVSDTVVVGGEQEILSFKATGVAEGICMTDFQVVPVEAVYDVRIAQRQMDFVNKLLDDENFNTADAAGARNNVAKVVNAINQKIESDGLEDENDAESLLIRMSQALAAYMNVNTTDIATEEYFKYVTDITQMPHYNRGNIASGTQVGGFMFRGDNWFHQWGRDENNKPTLANNPIIWKQIQGTNYNNGPGSVALYSTLMPAGKYYVAAEMRNADCANDYTLTWNLESPVKAFVGNDSLQVGTIVGEEFTKFYFVGTLNEGETFEAGFYWDNQDPNGSTFQIQNFEIRSFGNNADKVARQDAWNKFKAQYDAMVNGRKDVEALVGDKNYPWGQQILTDSLNKWNPKYDAEVAKGWVADDGSDAYVATLEELQDWEKQQGQNPEAEGYQNYPIVRGYQGAKNKVIAANKVFPDLAADIVAAKEVLNDGKNVNGDKKTFQAAIDAAQSTHDNLLASTTDATMEADSLTLAQARVDLAAAIEAFKASAEMTPFINIDFSNDFEAIEADGEVSAWVIKGEGGEMKFMDPSNVTSDLEEASPAWNAGNYTFEKGFRSAPEADRLLTDVLRVGKSEAVVNIDETFTDNDVIWVSFDMWVGSLIKCSFTVELRNAAGERVAGFNLNRYDGSVGFNDFNDEANTGLDLLKYVNGVGSNSAQNGYPNGNDENICIDINKSTFDLVVDYKANAVQGGVNSAKNGICTGAYLPIRSDVTDNKVTQFVIYSNYTNNTRRSWLDNFKVYKYVSSAEGTGIKTVNVKSADNAVYTLSGVRVKSAVKPGLYIKNGKKIMVK